MSLMIKFSYFSITFFFFHKQSTTWLFALLNKHRTSLIDNDLSSNSYQLSLNINHYHIDQESNSERDEPITNATMKSQYKGLILKDIPKN